MNKKRILSLLLAIVMVISLVPTYVFATEGEPTDPTVTEPVVTEPVVTEPVVTEPVVTEPAAPVGVECEVCGALDCQSTHENWCEICKVDDCGQTHAACDKCGAVDCQNTHENWCDVCKKDDCGQTHAACDKCGTVDCQSTHENWCEICKVDTCGKTHAACDKCGTVDCQSTHENWCEICKKDNCGQTHTTEPEVPAGPQVGDKIWIKSGSKTYVNPDKGDVWGNSRDVLFNYETTIVSIITDENGNAQWYEFKPTGLLQIFASYKYVKVENTTTVKPDEQPEDEHACNCGENAPENLASHADSCPRKQYIKTLFEGKTAEEIYAQWETYDEATRNDILAMLEVYDQVKFEELKLLISGEEEFETFIQYEDATLSGVSVNVSAPEGAFPEGTTVTVTDVDVSASSVNSLIDGEIKEIVALDISFNGQQPKERVGVTIEIPESKVPDDANMVTIVHFGAAGPEVIGNTYLNTATNGVAVSFAAGGFSTYAAVFVNGEYSSQKMSTVLAGDNRYSLEKFNVDLFDYDPVTINNALNGVTSDGNGFHFTGYGIAGCGSNNGINNSESTHAKQGILENELSDGMPVFKYVLGSNAGVNTGKVLFSDSEYTGVKTTYNNIPFEFIYDNVTKYYEYRSSANHAQLNDAGTKIELYADTLSTENTYAATISLSTATGTNDIVSGYTASANLFSGTVKDTDGGGRLDPYALFTVGNVAANTVSQIYVRAKVPADIGTNMFQLFFTTNNSTGWSEDKSFGNEAYSKAIQYTATGDWIEFVIDTSDNPNWKDTITAIRVDPFDSNKGTVDKTKTYKIDIDQIRFIKKNDDRYATRGGFYPFSEIQDSYPGNNVAFDLGTWKSLIQDSTKTNVTSSRSIYNPTPNPATDLYSELAYGMVMEFDFYLPVNWNGDDLTYYFNGDDDLWVFVDNQLVLDIGGGHGAINGTVNFTKHTWNVEKANTVTGYNSGANSAHSAKSGTIPESVYSPGKHTMKIFYLERGGSVSNCFMKFNLPRTPSGDVTVSKTVVEETGADNSVLINELFEFQITAQNQGAGDHTISNLANEEYILVDGNGTTSVKSTDADGKFWLKHGQEAVFNVDENHNVTVTETQKDILGYDYVSTTVNGTEGLTATQLTAVNQQKDFDFVNTYREKQVTITYIPVNPDDCADNYKGTVELTGNDATATYEETGVSETIGVRVGVPVGSTATDTKAVKFVGWYSDPECTVKIEDDKIFMPQKPTGSELWESATYYAKFEHNFGNLKINKQGIQNVDHHAPTATNGEETQTTIYTIRGTTFAGETISMQVAIVGNSSVTIRDIPVGKYTVTEDTDWSWRYDTTDNGREVEVVGGKTAETTFVNTRTEIYWLSGDSYCENWWGGENGTVVRKDEA